VKRIKPTLELISVTCVCGKAVIRAKVQKLSVGVLSANVPGDVLPCPSCGSTDIQAAREADEKTKSTVKK
jgi:hypothetical protein